MGKRINKNIIVDKACNCIWWCFEWLGFNKVLLSMLVVVKVLEWLMCACSLLAKQVKHQIVTFWNGCMCIFCCDDNFMDKIMFSVNEVDTKVVDNFLILLVLKFHDYRPDGLGVIDFRSLLSGFCMSSGQIWMIVLFGLFKHGIMYG